MRYTLVKTASLNVETYLLPEQLFYVTNFYIKNFTSLEMKWENTIF